MTAMLVSGTGLRYILDDCGWGVGIVCAESCLLLLCFVHTQITFSWSLWFATGPDGENSEVLLRVGLALYSWALAPSEYKEGLCSVWTLGLCPLGAR